MADFSNLPFAIIGFETQPNDSGVLPNALHLSDARSLHQIRKPRKPVVARIEVWSLLGQMRPYFGKVCPAIVLSGRTDRMNKHLDRGGVELGLNGRRPGRGRSKSSGQRRIANIPRLTLSGCWDAQNGAPQDRE